MKIDFSNFDFAEVVEIEGIKKVQYRIRGQSDITTEEHPKDVNLLKLKETANWALPGNLNPSLDKDPDNYEFKIDHDERIGSVKYIPNVLRRIAVEIDDILNRCYSFVDPNYSTLITMFILDTYFKRYFEYAPRIKIEGDSQGGKSKIMKMSKGLGYRVKQSVDISEAALFRSVEMFNATYLYDESQDINQESRVFFNKIWKAGAERDSGGVERCDMDLIPMSFDVYSPMMKSVITGNRDKNDVDNRTFVIHTRRKANLRLEKPDEGRLKELRTALYRMKICVDRYNYCMDLKRLAEDSEKNLSIVENTEEEVSNAIKSYSFLYDYKRKEGILDNRPLDMAVPYYTLAKITGFEKEIIPLCYELRTRTIESDMDSIQGRIFRAWLEIAEEPSGEEIIGTLNKYTCKDRLFEISSYDIMNRYNEKANLNGEKVIGTNYVTNMLQGWGFKINEHKNTQGKKFVVKDHEFRDNFNQKLDTYGDEDQYLIFHLV